MARPGVRSVVALAVVCAVGAGFAVGVVLTEPEEPADLQGSADLTVVPVSDRVFDDARTVTLRVAVDDVASITTLAAGRVTASSCAPGAAVASGTTVVSVDGKALVNLATSVPLWRSLTVGDRGADVTALHAELIRLGYGAPDGDRVTRATITAFRDLARAIGAAEPVSSVIDDTAIVWLPAATVTVGTCEVEVGAALEPGDTLLDLPAGLASAVVAPLPADAVPGDRVLVVDGQPVPVGPDGSVTDPAALQVLAQSRTLAEAVAVAPDAPQLSLVWSLATPLTVLVVPPSAVVGLGGPATCVEADDGQARSVTIVGSQLGQTFVTPAAGAAPFDNVQVTPDASVTCG